MPSKISIGREVIFLRALADTGNATLAAERAGVSWSWAYKRREVDARFDALFREITALARAGTTVRGSPPVTMFTSSDASAPLRR